MANVTSPEIRAQIEQAIKLGQGVRAVARDLGVSKQTVSTYAQAIRGTVVAKIKNPGPKPVDLSRFILSAIPGRCACGCGQPTSQYTAKDATSGKKVGHYREWVKGHFSTARRMASAKEGLSQLKRIAANDRLRAEMVAAFHRDRFATRDDIVERFMDRGHDKPNLTKIFVNGLRDLSYKVNEDELAVPKPRPAPIVPRMEPYERKPIAYETETDVDYLTRSPRFSCLDAAMFEDGGSTRHERIPSLSMDPAEIMMMEEEMEETRDAVYRRDGFVRWEEMNRPLGRLAEALVSAR